MTLVIPVCSGNISGSLEIISFCLFKVFLHVHTAENAIKQTKDIRYYFEIIGYRKFANSAKILICPFTFVEFFQKHQDFKENVFNRKFEFHFLFSTSLQNVFHFFKCLFGDAGDG